MRLLLFVIVAQAGAKGNLHGIWEIIGKLSHVNVVTRFCCLYAQAMLLMLFILGIISASAAESASVSKLRKHAVFGLVESCLPRIEIL